MGFISDLGTGFPSKAAESTPILRAPELLFVRLAQVRPCPPNSEAAFSPIPLEPHPQNPEGPCQSLGQISASTPSSEHAAPVPQLFRPVTPVWQLAEDPDVPPLSSPEPAAPPFDPIGPVTKLRGEAVFVLVQPTGEPDNEGEDLRLSLGSRVRLNLETSFTGQDRLRLRLQTVDVAEFNEVFDTETARLSIQDDEEGEFDLSRLDYRFPLGDRTRILVPIVGGSISDIADPLNPLFDSSGNGAISRFGQRNPLYRQGGGAGVGIDHELSDRVNLSLGYLSDAENLLPEAEFVAFAQVTVEPIENFKVGLLYAFGVNALDTGTGSEGSNDPFDENSDDITTHSVGLQATAELIPKLILSGWAGFTRAMATDLPGTPKADVLNWAITMGYQDLLIENAIGGLSLGQPPYVLASEDPNDPSFHLELFYKIQLNDHIAVTPGVVVITNPDGELDRDPIVVGVIRTTFQF